MALESTNQRQIEWDRLIIKCISIIFDFSIKFLFEAGKSRKLSQHRVGQQVWIDRHLSHMQWLRAHPRCKNLSNSRMTKNKENKGAKRPLNNNQTPARAKKTKKKCHRILHRGKPWLLHWVRHLFFVFCFFFLLVFCVCFLFVFLFLFFGGENQPGHSWKHTLWRHMGIKIWYTKTKTTNNVFSKEKEPSPIVGLITDSPKIKRWYQTIRLSFCLQPMLLHWPLRMRCLRSARLPFQWISSLSPLEPRIHLFHQKIPRFYTPALPRSISSTDPLSRRHTRFLTKGKEKQLESRD